MTTGVGTKLNRVSGIANNSIYMLALFLIAGLLLAPYFPRK